LHRFRISNSHSTLTFEALETFLFRIAVTGKLCFSKNPYDEIRMNCTKLAAEEDHSLARNSERVLIPFSAIPLKLRVKT
jgi:hypothetical protein